MMPTRMYVDTRTSKLAHAKPSTQPGIILWYFDKDGQPQGRCHASTVEEFNQRFRVQPRRASTRHTVAA